MKDYSKYHFDDTNEKLFGDATYMFEIMLNSNVAEDIVVDGLQHRAIITTKYSNNLQQSVKRVTAKMDVFNIGSVIEYAGKTWLLVSVPEKFLVNQSGLMKLCNNKLMWKSDSVLFETPCILTVGRRFDSFVDPRETVITQDGIAFALVQANSDTEKIGANYRFVLSGKVYSVEGIDNLTYAYDGDGLISLTLKIDEAKPNDDFVNGIADNSRLTQNGKGWDK